MDAKLLMAAVIALVGLFYIAAPHNVHISSGIGFGLEHTMHIAIGVVLLLAAGALYFMSPKATPAARKKRR